MQESGLILKHVYYASSVLHAGCDIYKRNEFRGTLEARNNEKGKIKRNNSDIATYYVGFSQESDLGHIWFITEKQTEQSEQAAKRRTFLIN
jgi:hypothetical protein